MRALRLTGLAQVVVLTHCTLVVNPPNLLSAAIALAHDVAARLAPSFLQFLRVGDPVEGLAQLHTWVYRRDLLLALELLELNFQVLAQQKLAHLQFF